MIVLANEAIRKAARNANVPLWRVGEALGVSEATVTRMLRHELDDARKESINGVIRNLSEGRNCDGNEEV